MIVNIINSEEVNLKEMKAQLKAELMFMFLMKQPPDIRAELYHKFMNSNTDKTA